MNERAATLRNDVNRILFWCFATLVLGTWALCGFLPFAGLLIEGASPLFLVGQAAFLLTGFVGVLGLVLLAQLLTPAGGGNTARRMLSGRIGLLTAYATVWLITFGLFVYFTEPPMVSAV